MAIYSGTYYGSFRVFQNSKLTIRSKNANGGSFSITSESIDRQFVPEIFFSQASSSRFSCPLNFTLKRFRLWLDEENYLEVPNYFRENSTEINQFLYQVSIDSNIFKIEMFPEIINYSRLSLWLIN